MASNAPTNLSKEDEKYLEQVFDKMQGWVKEKTSLENYIRILEEKLEKKCPEALKSSRDIHGLEKKNIRAAEKIEDMRIEIGLLEEKIEFLESRK